MIDPFDFARIPRIRFGVGEFRNLADHAASFGKNILVVSGSQSLRTSGRLQELNDFLHHRSLTCSVVETPGEPSPELVDATVAEFGEKQVSVVIGVGGGSAVDAAKAISAMLPYGGSVWDYLEGVGTKGHPGGKIPFIAVPTTSGTGSEATKNAVLSRVGPDGFKKSLRHDNLVPDLAILDPELTLACPAKLTAACGMDAFSQLLESYVSTNASPMTDSLAIGALKHLLQSLQPACGDGAKDVRVRARMAYASFISGITLANAGLGVVHGLASPLGGFFSIPHGVVCGSLLGPSMKITIEKLRRNREQYGAALEKFASVGALVGRCAPDEVDGCCDALVEKIYELTDALEIPRLSDYGITIADFDKIIKNTGNKNNPVQLDQDDIGRILQERVR